MKMKKAAAVALLALLAAAVPAQNIRIAVPYLGVATNVYEDDESSIDSSDSALMEGFFFQWVNPDLFLANAFIYHSADINHSQLWGGHLIGDFYVWSDPLGKAAVGGGIEVIRLDMDAGDEFSDSYLYDFELPTTMTIPYVRAGHYFNFGSRDKVALSVFPWVGAEYDITRGDVSFVVDPPGPGSFPVDESIDDETFYGIAGLNVGATIMHFVELQAKYRLTFNENDLLHTFDGMANVYFSRSWGLSYRYKYMQSTSGSTSYHIVGIAYVF